MEFSDMANGTTDTFDAVLADMLGESTLFLHEITDYHTRLAAAHAAEVEALKESLDGKRHEANAAWVAAEAAERDARELLAESRKLALSHLGLLTIYGMTDGVEQTRAHIAAIDAAIATTEQADED